ncbi:hypothetical protein MLD38_002105 [Melastoma candidum]|uniref:Uncharacterized protein n=1 Tax=Melastoma candidum TaxID=119954 RepID=A0ACB9SFH5_9MYRT|nr:hypothetical protein MLD38_002105 [Melastoma candidum]
MEEQILALIIVGVISWTTIFLFLRKVLPKRSYEFCNRTVSTIHATLAVFLASRSVGDWRSPISPLAAKPSPAQMRALAVTLSYLLYDLVCCMLDDKRITVDTVIHHVVSISGIGAGIVYGKSGSELVAALWITELSSPFLHARELLKELGYRDTDLNLAVDIVFAVIFSVARMVGGPYLAFKTLSADNPIIVKAMAVGLQLVSAFWFYRIARMVKYKLTKRNSPKVA